MEKLFRILFGALIIALAIYWKFDSRNESHKEALNEKHRKENVQHTPRQIKKIENPSN